MKNDRNLPDILSIEFLLLFRDTYFWYLIPIFICLHSPISALNWFWFEYRYGACITKLVVRTWNAKLIINESRQNVESLFWYRACIYFLKGFSKALRRLLFSSSFSRLRWFKSCGSKRYICYLPAGWCVLGKTVLEALSTPARGRRPWAVLKTEGTVFPNTYRPRPANNVFIFSSLENYFMRNISVEFLLKQFHTLRLRLVKQTCVVYRSI